LPPAPVAIFVRREFLVGTGHSRRESGGSDVVGGVKIYGAASGRTGLEGRAKSTADEIATQLRIRFQDRGWIAQD
jgi:hypothetical protein